MSDRRRWLVAYDIRDPKRLRKVYDVVRDHGDRLQYSVFLCDLDPMEKIGLMSELRDVIKHVEDSIAFIDLGDTERRGRHAIEFMGTSLPLPESGPIII